MGTAENERSSFHISDLMQSTGSQVREQLDVHSKKEGYGNYNLQNKGSFVTGILKGTFFFCQTDAEKIPVQVLDIECHILLGCGALLCSKPDLQVTTFTPSSKIWGGGECEGLQRSCTTKGQKEGTGGNMSRYLQPYHTTKELYNVNHMNK